MEGLDAILKNVEHASAEIREGARKGLFAGAEHVLGVSNDRVPHEEGDLEDTGGSSVDGKALRAAVSYDDSAYKGQAIDQHENMEYKHDGGRSAKYLELAMHSESTVAGTIIANIITREAGLK